MSELLDPLFGTDDAEDLWSDRARLAGILAFEAALAKAEARVGVIPESAVAPIAAACEAGRYDPAALGRAAAEAGNPAIPLLRALTKEVSAGNSAAWRTGSVAQCELIWGVSELVNQVSKMSVSAEKPPGRSRCSAV